MNKGMLIVGVLLLCLGGFTFASTIDTPVAHWAFDEASGTTAYDSANNHHGTLVNGVSRAQGKLGGALNFDGVNDRVDVPYSSAFQLPALTFTAWVRPASDFSSSGGWVVGQGEDSVNDNAGFSMGMRPTWSPGGYGLGVGYETSSDTDIIYNTNVYPQVGKWTHIATSRSSNGQINIYTDGNLIGQFNATPTPTSVCHQNMTIGAYLLHNGGVSFMYLFTGLIDDVRIYNYALNAGEVLQLYQIPEPATVLLLLAGGIMLKKGKKQ